MCVCTEKRKMKKQKAAKLGDSRRRKEKTGQDTTESVSFCEFLSLEKEHLKSLFFHAVDDRLCVFRRMKTNVRRGCSKNYKKKKKEKADKEIQNALTVES